MSLKVDCDEKLHVHLLVRYLDVYIIMQCTKQHFYNKLRYNKLWCIIEISFCDVRSGSRKVLLYVLY